MQIIITWNVISSDRFSLFLLTQDGPFPHYCSLLNLLCRVCVCVCVCVCVYIYVEFISYLYSSISSTRLSHIVFKYSSLLYSIPFHCILFYFLATVHSMQDLSSLIRDQTCIHWSGSIGLRRGPQASPDFL